MPVKVGVVFFVMPSLFELPASVAAVITGALGAAGVEVMIVTVVPAEAVPVLPARSVAFAAIVCWPAPSAEVVML